MMETLIILHLLDFVCFSHGNEARILFANKIRILRRKYMATYSNGIDVEYSLSPTYFEVGAAYKND